MATNNELNDIAADVWLTQIVLLVDVNAGEPPRLIVRDFQCGPEKYNGYYLSGERLDLSVPLSRFLGFGSNAYVSPEQFKTVRDNLISPVKLEIPPSQVNQPALQLLGRKDLNLAQGRYANGVLFYERTCYKAQKEAALKAIIAQEHERNSSSLKRSEIGLREAASLAEKCGIDLPSSNGHGLLGNNTARWNSPNVSPPTRGKTEVCSRSIDVLVGLANPSAMGERYRRIAYYRAADPDEPTSTGAWFDSGSEGWELTGWVLGWQELPPVTMIPGLDVPFQVERSPASTESTPMTAKRMAAPRSNSLASGPTP